MGNVHTLRLLVAGCSCRLQLPVALTDEAADGDRRTTAAKREQHKQESTEKMLLGIFVIDIK